MPRYATLALLLLTAGFAGADEPTAPPRQRPMLPGAQADGSVRLPSTWSIRPAGAQVELGDFPVNLALHPNRKWLAVLHAGWGAHEIHIVDLRTTNTKVASRVVLTQTFQGLAFAPDGKTLYASGGEFDTAHAFDFADGFLTHPRQLKLADAKFVTAGLAVAPDSQTLYAAGLFGHAAAIVPVDRPNDRVHVPLGKDSYPYGCVVDRSGERLYVSLWARAAIAVIDLHKRAVVQTLPTEPHPTEMAFGPDEKTLFVACSNSTRVSVIDVLTGKPIETINAAIYPNAPSGNTPCSISLTPDGALLFVANSNANNIAVFNVAHPGKSLPLGFIPTGMYPTAVRFNSADNRIYVANARGATPKANPNGPNPLLPKNPTVREYIAGLYRGTLSVIEMPNEAVMARYSKQALACSPLLPSLDPVGPVPEGNAIPAKVGAGSPIKYCIYVIRENRTYDQVFGDLKEGNGAANLCIFPEQITPNVHRLARQFVLLDNFYCEGEVSAEGHEWTMGAYCTDFVRKIWPLTYRRSPTKKLGIYPSEGHFDSVARPAGGYIWDRCAAAKVSYRSYAEWCATGKTLKDPSTPRVKALEGHIDPWYRAWDLDYPDVKRAQRFLEEMRRFEKEGGMPQLSIMRLGNDHTEGTRLGKHTPTAMVAENDLALGLLIEGITQSKFWKETAVFIIEDDAQNGSDHVDAHRTVALAISPYTQHGRIDSTMYATSAMLRTMELILGLEPMSQFDAAARPMYAAFQGKPNFAPYKHVIPQTDMQAKNTAAAWGVKMSERFDFSREDAADDLLLNEVIWRSVRGAGSPMPPPVHAAFVYPHLED